MPSVTEIESRRWREFLSEVDRRLVGPTEIHCVGGFVATVRYERPRTTGDLDYFEILPLTSTQDIQKIAGEGSELAKKYGYCIRAATVADLPESYKDRLTEVLAGAFANLKLLVLEPHDLALSKLTRNIQVDREDVEYLAKAVPLDPVLLRTRYREEFRPIAIGDLAKYDRTLDMWIEAYFPPRR